MDYLGRLGLKQVGVYKENFLNDAAKYKHSLARKFKPLMVTENILNDSAKYKHRLSRRLKTWRLGQIKPLMILLLPVFIAVVQGPTAVIAVAPTNVELVAAPTGTKIGQDADKLWAVANTETSVTLTCTATDSSGGTEFQFTKKGHASVLQDFSTTPTYAITSFNTVATGPGEYSCTARDGGPDTDEAAPQKLTLTYECPNAADTGVCDNTANHAKCTEATSSSFYCKCKFGAKPFGGSCDVCKKNAEDGCDTSKHEICKDDGSGCKCKYGKSGNDCNATPAPAPTSPSTPSGGGGVDTTGSGGSGNGASDVKCHWTLIIAAAVVTLLNTAARG